MRYTHQINQYGFNIEQNAGEWFWTNNHSESESTFPAQSEAIAAAIRWVRERDAEAIDQAEYAEQCRMYGSYEAQVRGYYNSARL